MWTGRWYWLSGSHGLVERGLHRCLRRIGANLAMPGASLSHLQPVLGNEEAPVVMIESQRLHTFISYAREDRHVVEEGLVPLLKQSHYVPWWDTAGIQGGEDFERRIVEQLRVSDIFLLVMSPDSQASQWVKDELHVAFYLNLKVLPLLYRPSDPLAFHIRLPRLQMVDVQESLEPLSKILTGDAPVQQLAPESETRDLATEFAAVAITLLPWQELNHLRNLARETTLPYTGSRLVQPELRHLCDLDLLRRKPGRQIAELEGDKVIDLTELVAFTNIGRALAKHIR